LEGIELVWLLFALAASVVFISGMRLSNYGEAIATNTKLGRLWVGSVLLAGATSLPEVMASVSAGVLNLPDIALGNVFGSNVFNMIIISVVDMVGRKSGILAKASPGHIISASFGMLLSATAAVFILLRMKITLFGAGVDSLVLAVIYLAGLRLLSRYEQRPPEEQLTYMADGTRSATVDNESVTMPLNRAVIGFVVSTLLIVAAGYTLSYSAGEIAVITGLGTTFVGSIMIAMVTSLPELVTSISAIRIGAVDMAVGNVLGSNIFNILIIFFADLAYRGGPILSAGSQLHAVTSLFGLILSGIVVIGLSYRSKRNIAGIGWDSIIIALVYLLIAYVLFQNTPL
jgi:cation:H+ antiporter